MPVDIENARLKLALAIPTDASITAANDAIKMLPVLTDKTIKDFFYNYFFFNLFTEPFTR